MKERAIVSYVEDKPFLIIEAHNLYKSCIESNIQNNTDLVFCAPKYIWKKLPKDKFVIYLETNSDSCNCDKNDEYCDLSWQGYHFVNSISCLAKNKEYLRKYNYILKTDCDVFITENFKDFFPNIFHVGIGGYNNDDIVKKRLKDIAKKLGYKHKGKFNIGATWYGDGNLIIKCSEITLKVLKIILGNFFKNGEGKWPGWFRGVASMYASEIAINHVVDDFIISDKFDSRCDSKNSWKDDGIYHIHSWYTDDIYSKNNFINNIYDNIDLNTLNTEKTNEYCLKIALSNLSILHSLQQEEKFCLPKNNIRNIYDYIMNNSNIDHYKLFNSKYNKYIIIFILIFIICLIFFIFYYLL